MTAILQPDKISGESKIVSFRVPAEVHEKLHQVTDEAKRFGMRLSWQDRLREHLQEYVQLADNELKKYGTNKSHSVNSTPKSLSA